MSSFAVTSVQCHHLVRGLQRAVCLSGKLFRTPPPSPVMGMVVDPSDYTWAHSSHGYLSSINADGTTVRSIYMSDVGNGETDL